MSTFDTVCRETAAARATSSIVTWRAIAGLAWPDRDLVTWSPYCHRESPLDLRGVTSRVPYLAALGIDAVWLSPFCPSALADGGYDVDDYRDVDPRLGTLADSGQMTTRLHARKIKVIVDIVPDHTSNRHAWFRAALAAPKGSPARNRSIFRDGLPPRTAASVPGDGC